MLSVQNPTILSVSGGMDHYAYQKAYFCYRSVENSVQTSQDSTTCMWKATNLKKVYPIIASFSYLTWLDEELPPKLAKVTSGRPIVDTLADTAVSFRVYISGFLSNNQHPFRDNSFSLEVVTLLGHLSK